MAALNVTTLCSQRSRGRRSWSAWRHWRPLAQALKAAGSTEAGPEGTEGSAVAWGLGFVGQNGMKHESIVKPLYCKPSDSMDLLLKSLHLFLLVYEFMIGIYIYINPTLLIINGYSIRIL